MIESILFNTKNRENNFVLRSIEGRAIDFNSG